MILNLFIYYITTHIYEYVLCTLPHFLILLCVKPPNVLITKFSCQTVKLNEAPSEAPDIISLMVFFHLTQTLTQCIQTGVKQASVSCDHV